MALDRGYERLGLSSSWEGNITRSLSFSCRSAQSYAPTSCAAPVCRTPYHAPASLCALPSAPAHPENLPHAPRSRASLAMSMQVCTPHGDWTMLTDDETRLLATEAGAAIQPPACAQQQAALQAYFQQNPPAESLLPIVILPISARAWPCHMRMGCLAEDARTISAAFAQATDRALDLGVFTDEDPPQMYLAGVEPDKFRACVAALAHPSPAPSVPGAPSFSHCGVFVGPAVPKGQSVLLTAYGRRKQHAQWRAAHPQGDLPKQWQYLVTKKLGEGIGGKLKDTLAMDRNAVSASPPRAAAAEPYVWDGQHGHSDMLAADFQARRNMSLPAFQATRRHLYGLKRDARFGLQELSPTEADGLRRAYRVSQGMSLVKIVSGAVCGPNGPFHLGVHLHEYQNMPQMEHNINPFAFEQPVGAWTPGPEHGLGFFPPTSPIPASLVWMVVCHSTAETGMVVQFISLATQAYLSVPDHMPTVACADRVTAKVHPIPLRGGDEPSVVPASPTPVEILQPALVASRHEGTLWLVEEVPESSFLYEYGDMPLQSLA